LKGPVVSASNIGGGRPLRVCDLCGGVDDHPRHSLAGTIPGYEGFPRPSQDVVDRVLDSAAGEDRARLLRDLYDTATSDRHLDCCAAAGCPEPGELSCANRTAGAKGTGKAMLTHLTKGA
jgi:hypothetical protein